MRQDHDSVNKNDIIHKMLNISSERKALFKLHIESKKKIILKDLPQKNDLK